MDISTSASLNKLPGVKPEPDNEQDYENQEEYLLDGSLLAPICYDEKKVETSKTVLGSDKIFSSQSATVIKVEEHEEIYEDAQMYYVNPADLNVKKDESDDEEGDLKLIESRCNKIPDQTESKEVKIENIEAIEEVYVYPAGWNIKNEEVDIKEEEDPNKTSILSSQDGIGTHLPRHKNPKKPNMLKCEQCDYQSIYKTRLEEHLLQHKNTGEMTEPTPKRKKALWDPAKMKAALEAVHFGRKVKEVARTFDLPESSIRDRLKRGEYYEPRMGRHATFTKEEENELKEHIVLLAKTFFGVTQQQLRKLAYEFANEKNIKNIFSTSTEMAGKCWVYSYLKRNPGISLRAPEPTSMNRVLGFNKTEINIFYSNLEELLEKYNFTANRIFNMDETGFSTVQRPGKILSGERGQNVTVVCAFSASGIYIPPMFIFPRQRMKPSMMTGGPIQAAYECSKSGCINEELFVTWLKHFAKHVGTFSEGHRTLLVLDNHSSHISLDAYLFCRENGIHMLSLPPHTSHKMQPLEVAFFGPLKSAYNRECDLYMKNCPYEKITHDVLAPIFNKAYVRVSSMDKAVKGFEVTGIYPVNPHIFQDDEFTSNPRIEDFRPHRNDKNEETVAATEIPLVVNNDEPIPSTSKHILQKLSPMPEKVRRHTTKQQSKILTSIPLKEQLEGKESKNVEKESRAKGKNRGKNIPGKTLAKGKACKRKLGSGINIQSSDDDLPLAVLSNN